MKRKRKLILTAIISFLAVVVLLTYSFDAMLHVFPAILILLVLAVISVHTLSDLLLTWLKIFSIGLGIIVLFFGVPYIHLEDRLFLIFMFPLALVFFHHLVHLNRWRLNKLGDKTEQAKAFYEGAGALLMDSKKPDLQIVLVQWAHNQYYEELYPEEFRRMLRRIAKQLKRHLSGRETFYYVFDGSFMIFSSNSNFKQVYQEEILPHLEQLRFHNVNTLHEVQYQSGYLTVNQDNWQKYDSFDTIFKNLERQLETDIIVEY